MKTALLSLSLLLSAGMIGARVSALGVSSALVIYLGLFAFLVLCLFCAAWAPNKYLRWPVAVLLGASTCLSLSIESTMGEPLTYETFINLMHARGSLSDALAQFGAQIAFPATAGIAALIGIWLAPASKIPVNQAIGTAAPFAAIGLLSVMFFVRGGEGSGGLPGAFVPPAMATIYAIDGVINAPGPRQPVRIARRGPPVARDIVLIVDESISANYLDINMPGGVRSGLAGPRAGFAIHNFGFASSITHCSVGTNLTLRHGGTREDYRRINATGPAIWAYAKGAGLQTVYVDAQGKPGVLQNQMDEAEAKQVDRFIQLYATPIVDRDHAAARTITNLLNDNVAQFIYVNKMGAHFPVADKYPATEMRYRPAAQQGRYLGVAELSAREVFRPNGEDWRLYRNAYRNTVEWNVGRFFDQIFAGASSSAATIIYTSDHGQDLHERGNPGAATHCEPVAVMEQGLVPLVVIEAGQPTRDWAEATATGHNARSHYRIFPTMLALMGYDAAAVQRSYGKALHDPGQDALEFNTRFNAKLGADPVWKKIDLDKIVRPPSSDVAAEEEK